jgi:hypothetical protein
MAVLDDFLARIGGKGMPQTFGNSIGLGTPIDTYKQGVKQTNYDMSPTNIGLSGGVNAMNLPIQVGGGAMSNFGFTGMGMGAKPLTQPLTATRPRGFGSRLGDVFKDPRKFADLATGAALISGTPIAEAFAIRDALAPTTTTDTSKSVGTLYNIRDLSTNQLTGEQVYSTDRARMTEVAANPKLGLEEVGEAVPAIEKGKLPEGYERIDAGDGTGRTIIKAEENSTAAQELQNQIRKSEQVLQIAKTQVQNAKMNRDVIINYMDETGIEGGNKLGIALSEGGRILDREGQNVVNAVENLLVNNFRAVIQQMRDSSKTGGAVGNVTEKELALLSQSVVPLDPRATNFRSNVEYNTRYIIDFANKVAQNAIVDIDNDNEILYANNKLEVGIPDMFQLKEE